MGSLRLGGSAVCSTYTQLVKEILGQPEGSSEGCHDMIAATHLICGWKSKQQMHELFYISNQWFMQSCMQFWVLRNQQMLLLGV